MTTFYHHREAHLKDGEELQLTASMTNVKVEAFVDPLGDGTQYLCKVSWDEPCVDSTAMHHTHHHIPYHGERGCNAWEPDDDLLQEC